MTGWIMGFYHHLRTQEEYNKAVYTEPLTLVYVPDHFKTQGMCDEAVRNNPAIFFLIPDQFKTQEMCTKTVEAGLCQLNYIMITSRPKKCVKKSLRQTYAS